MGTLSFLRESLRNLKTVGTITRSSPALCKAVIKPVNFANSTCVVELGAGDGVITKHILRAMRPDAKLLAFEVNPNFCDRLRALDDDRLIVCEDSAERLDHYLQINGLDHVDAVVSAIPFVALPDEVAFRIVTCCREALREGAPFCQVHYSLLAKHIYEKIFGSVSVNFVPMNVPPAFVLTAHKAAA